MKPWIQCQTCGCAVVADGVADPVLTDNRSDRDDLSVIGLYWPEGDPDLAVVHREVIVRMIKAHNDLVELLRATRSSGVTEDTTDGFHTFRELYAVRLALTMALFRALDGRRTGISPWRSRLHHDGERPFGGGWIVVGVVLPGYGQVTYHYPEANWDDFDIPGVLTLERAPLWDGHDTVEAVRRLSGWAVGR